MTGLNFIYGTMNSSKTANLLMSAHNYIERGHNVRLFKPSIDTRDTLNTIKSRIGLKAEPVEIINPTESFLNKNIKNDDILFIDESQFLTTNQIEELRKIANVTAVFCYGLLTDFKSKLFAGSKRLIEISDCIKEIESICDCGRKTNINARLVNGKPVLDGPQVLIGGNETYKSMCYYCWEKNLKK